MFTDTLTITVNAVAKVLNRVREQDYSSEYYLRESASEFSLNIRNTRYTDPKRDGVVIDRHNVEFVERVFPVAPATHTIVRKVYAVFENEAGDPVLSNVKHAAGGLAFLTEANLTKLTNRES